MLSATFSKRFSELGGAYSSIKIIPYSDGRGGYVDEGEWKRWATSVQNLIKAVFGERSPHYQNFHDAFAKCHGDHGAVKALNGIFLAAKDDFDGGYVFHVDLQVSGEVFGDFVGLARQSLSEGHKDVAAVLACAALEDALKRFAMANGVDVDGKDMQNVVNALKSAGLVAGAQKSLLDTMPKIRNLALHAEWSKIQDADVSSVIGYVEQFLLTKFPGN